jgi:MFS family permease
MAKSAKSSSWTALRNRGFRAIWLASVISGICASAHGTAATWAINQLSHSTLLLSLMSTFSSLPFFVFTLPAGAFADMMNRAKLVRIMHVWLAASAAGLAILGWLHLLNGNLILLFVSLIGAGFAFNAPAFSSLLTDIVSDEELPSASVLSGLQLDIAGMIGPALGGALIPLIGTNTIFAANAACFRLINLALKRCQQPKEQPHSAMENFFQSFATAVPGWARGRMNATVLMFSQGAMALGGVIYGTAAQTFGVTAVLVAVAGFILVLLLTFRLLSSPLSIDFTQRLSFESVAVDPLSQNFIYVPQPRDGPVLITIDFQVDETRGCELDSFMNELRLVHLRNGAYSWQLFADPARPNHFHVQIMMPSWSQYVLHFERITKAEKEVIDRAISLPIGEDPPETRMYIRVNKTLREEEWKN